MSVELFGHVQEFPDEDSGRRFDALVGLDDVKERLVNEAVVLLNQSSLDAWSKVHHGGPIAAIEAVRDRAPLIVLAGDVGTGKTEIAETVGHRIAQALRTDVTLYPLSLSTRGSGLVGQMTTLITAALTEIREIASRARGSNGALNRAILLLVDEADSVAQSRELAQMHHEDRAGVNALIQGIDGFRRDRLPVLTLMCTNRAASIDPAVARRAAHVFEFARPNQEQRTAVLRRSLADAGVSMKTIDQVSEALGSNDARTYGATYSDLRQRFVPDAVMDAYGRDEPLGASRLLQLARRFQPTRPFADQSQP